MQPAFPAFSNTVTLCRDGLVLGAGTRLATFTEGTNRLAIDPPRVAGLLATTFGTAPSDAQTSAIEAAASHWQRGDKAVANLRLVFANLPQLDAPAEVVRLKAAEIFFDAGLTAADVAEHLGANEVGLGKYDPGEQRVPSGQGKDSGRWTSGVWSRFRAWLDEEVPVYDPDTGDKVGTQSRAWAIATNPLTILAVGAVAILAGEVILPIVAAGAIADVAVAAATAVEEAEVVTPVVSTAADVSASIVEEAEALTPWAQRYLSTSGGRLGGTATRQQLYEIAQEYVKSDEFVEYEGDGEAPEEYIPGRGPGTTGSTFVDFTAWRADGSAVRIQTIDTLADGITPVAREAAAADRIRDAFSGDILKLIPKRRQ